MPRGSSPHARLAESAAKSFVLNKARLDTPEYLTDDLRGQRACYVSMFAKPGNRLRAHAGHIMPTCQNLAEEIITHTCQGISTSSHALRRTDLNNLSYVVTVLSPMERIAVPAQLAPDTFGLHIISDTGKQTTMLPGRPGIESSDDQLTTALREAGIDTTRDSYTMYRFSAERYE